MAKCALAVAPAHSLTQALTRSCSSENTCAAMPCKRFAPADFTTIAAAKHPRRNTDLDTVYSTHTIHWVGLSLERCSRCVWEKFWMHLLVPHLQMLVPQLQLSENQKLRNFSVFVFFSTIENASIQLFVGGKCQLYVRRRDCDVLTNISRSLLV